MLCHSWLGKFMGIWGRYPGKEEFIEGREVSRDPPSRTTHLSRGMDFGSLEISCHSRIPALTWRMAIIQTNHLANSSKNVIRTIQGSTTGTLQQGNTGVWIKSSLVKRSLQKRPLKPPWLSCFCSWGLWLPIVS